MEECEHHEHVGEIDLITALAEPSHWPPHAGTFPIALRRGNDEQASTEGQNGHIEASAFESEIRTLNRKTKNEGDEGRSNDGNYAKSGGGGEGGGGRERRKEDRGGGGPHPRAGKLDAKARSPRRARVAR